jgi:hypothetical protein
MTELSISEQYLAKLGEYVGIITGLHKRLEHAGQWFHELHAANKGSRRLRRKLDRAEAELRARLSPDERYERWRANNEEQIRILELFQAYARAAHWYLNASDEQLAHAKMTRQEAIERVTIAETQIMIEGYQLS